MEQQLSIGSVHPSTRYHLEAHAYYHADGERCRVAHDRCPLDHARKELLWTEDIPNIVTTAGKNKLLDATLKTGLTSPAWFLGLVDGGSAPTYAAGDTMASHAGWTESAAYSNATRPAWTPGAIAGGSVDNSGSPAVFNVNATATIAGAFMADNSTKSGTTGTLYGEANFTGGNRSVLSGDTLTVTATPSIS